MPAVTKDMLSAAHAVTIKNGSGDLILSAGLGGADIGDRK